MEIGILNIILAIIGIIISIWNAYASGYSSEIIKYHELRGEEGGLETLMSILNQFGLIFAFAGATYYTAIILAYILLILGWISKSVVIAMLSLNQIVFGGLLVFTGLGVAIESILIAKERKDFLSIGIAIWNTIASLWNIFSYLSNFTEVLNIWQSSDEEDQQNAIILLIGAVLFGLVLTYVAYTYGKRKAREELGLIASTF